MLLLQAESVLDAGRRVNLFVTRAHTYFKLNTLKMYGSLPGKSRLKIKVLACQWVPLLQIELTFAPLLEPAIAASTYHYQNWLICASLEK